MRRTSAALALIATAALLVTACGGGGTQGNSTASRDVEVTLTTEPSPARTGDNTFNVMVMSGGKPITDADVSVELFMAAMPAMKMPEMRNTVPLKHEGGGRYSGAGNVMMAGSWDATVTVKRGDQVLAAQKLPVTAQ
jgi:YtkA-like